MDPAPPVQDSMQSLPYLWGAHLRLQAAVVPDNKQSRSKSAEALDALFFELLSDLEPDVFIEAGAFEATTSLRVKADFPRCRVVAFEANPDTHRRFSQVHNHQAQGVDYRCLALTDKPGPVTFHREDADDQMRAGSSSLLDRNRSGDVWVPDATTDEVTVEGMSLDDAVATHEGRAALWMDVEGAAGQVLAGAERSAKSWELVKVEVEDAAFWENQWRSNEVLDWFLQRGFVPLARDAEYPQQFNVLLARSVFATKANTVRAVEDYLRSLVSPPPTDSSSARVRTRGLARRVSRVAGRLKSRLVGR